MSGVCTELSWVSEVISCVIHSNHEHIQQFGATGPLGALVAFVQTISGPSANRNGPFVLMLSGFACFDISGSEKNG